MAVYDWGYEAPSSDGEDSMDVTTEASPGCSSTVKPVTCVFGFTAWLASPYTWVRTPSLLDFHENLTNKQTNDQMNNQPSSYRSQ